MHLRQWLAEDLHRPDRRIEIGQWPFLAGSSAVIIVVGQLTEPGPWPALLGLVLAGAALTSLALTAVPTLPTAFLVMVLVGLAVGSSGRLEAAFLLVNLLTVYVAWHTGSLLRSCAVAAAAIVVIAGVWLANPESLGWAPWVAAEVFTLALGRVLFAQHEAIVALRQAREELAQRAVADERRRIARELHDLAGHTLAAMMLHVTGARHVLRRDIDEADDALRQAEAVGRSGLAQVRTTVASLRTTEQGTDPPVPTALDLESVVGDYARAGVRVEAHIDPAARRLEGPLGLALTRICAESLANVSRHAVENSVRLDVVTDHEQVRVSVRDHGHAPPPANTTGYGVIGMVERARSVGGTLTAGPTQDGWLVDARLPLSPVPVPPS